MRKLLIFLGLAFGFGLGLHAPAAHAQQVGCGVNFTPQIGINCANVRSATYTGQILALVPAAAATDVWCLNASASKTVSIRRVELSGTAGTLITTPVIFIRRNTLDTGGTSTVPSITEHDLNLNPAATASAIQYSANPTVTDATSHQTIRAAMMTLNTATAAGVSPSLIWNFGTQVDAYDQGAVLDAGSTQQFCLNLNAATISTGSIYGTVEWTEQ